MNNILLCTATIILLSATILWNSCTTVTSKKVVTARNKTASKQSAAPKTSTNSTNKPTTVRRSTSPQTPEIVPEPTYRMSINFTKSIMIENALATAKASNKPVFIDFYADWCGPCRVMEQYVFTNASLGQYMNYNFVNYRFDGGNFDADPYLKRYKIQGYPTALFLAPDGRVLKLHFGSQGITEFRQMSTEVLRKWKTGK